MLVASVFFFSHHVFLRCLFQCCQMSGLCGKGLNLSHTSPCIHVSAVQVLKTLWEKENLLATSNFSFSYIVFNLSGEQSAIFINFEIVVCKLFEFGRV